MWTGIIQRMERNSEGQQEQVHEAPGDEQVRVSKYSSRAFSLTVVLPKALAGCRVNCKCDDVTSPRGGLGVKYRQRSHIQGQQCEHSSKVCLEEVNTAGGGLDARLMHGSLNLWDSSQKRKAKLER